MLATKNEQSVLENMQLYRIYRVIANEWTPFHTGFELFLIVLGKSDENMPYWLGLGDSFAMLYMAVTYLVQDLY